MKWELAYEFLKTGYPIRNLDWKPSEFIVLSSGGRIDLSVIDFDGLGLGPIVNDLLKELNPNRVLYNLPEVIKFENPQYMSRGFSMSTHDIMYSEYGVFTSKGTDPIDWKEGDIIQDKLGNKGQILKRNLTSIVTNLGSYNQPYVAGITYLYHEMNARKVVKESELN